MKNLISGAVRSFSFRTSVHKMTKVPSAFLEISNGSQKTRLDIKLFEDVNPEAVQNFLALCGQNNLTFRNKKFVNGMPGVFLETEEIKETIFGPSGYLDESYLFDLSVPGLVALSKGPNDQDNGTSQSGFIITFAELPDVGNHVVVGQVINGLDELKKMSFQSSPPQITNCGQGKDISLTH